MTRLRREACDWLGVEAPGSQPDPLPDWWPRGVTVERMRFEASVNQSGHARACLGALRAERECGRVVGDSGQATFAQLVPDGGAR